MLNALAQWIREHRDFVLLSHISPDGDTLASALALARALTALGKRARVVCEDPVPPLYQILPGWETVRRPEEISDAPEAALAVDCADEGRMGGGRALFAAATYRACIDHHGTNPGFGEVCAIDPEASATGELVAALLEALSVPLTGELALLLYAAIITDTGNFSYQNTTPRSLRVVATCVEAGVDVAKWSFLLLRRRSVPRTRLIGRALRGMRLLADGRIALLCLTRQDFEAENAEKADTDQLVNFGIETEGVSLSILVSEWKDAVRVSFRSHGDVDVSKLARRFGGGGHRAAAGATLSLSLPEALCALTEAAQATLTER